MGSWPTQRLDSLAEVGAGNPAPQDQASFLAGSVPFFRTSDVGRVHLGELVDAEDYLNEIGAKGLRLHPAGTVLMPKSGASTFTDHRVITTRPGYVSSHLATVKAKEDLAEDRFLYYALQTISARDVAGDSSYPTLSLAQVRAIEVPAPPIAEQKRIVTILDRVFEEVSAAEASTEKSIFELRQVFFEFQQEVLSAKPSWKSTDLGEVIALIRNGFNCVQSKSTGAHRVTRIETISTGFVDYERVGYAELPSNIRDKARLYVGDILFSHINSAPHIGKTALVREDEEIYHGINLLLIRPKEDVTPEFLEAALKAHQALGCRGVSRSDFRFDEKKDRLVILETNTQPGMTPTSLVPEQAAYTGMTFEALVAWMIEDASCRR